ncbi:hypothetical protein DL98DRAFT_630560 [Cadophora sp. DSE1049]|nr:hypothetical protein DL98DRAFT_630560 [Cadophora sp. DSE1049]
MLANGQRPPQPMAAGMNPQQQMLLQQQMTSLRQTQMQQQRIPQNAAQMEQRTIAQMDNVDIPQIFQNHYTMPQGTPPEIKKWSQLKQWISQNPNAAPSSLDAVKQLQKMHYTQAMRSRQQQGQAGVMPPGAQGPQGGVPTAPAMAAPVALMGQNPMQVPNGMNMAGLGQLRQPTTQEIHTMRNHPSGKLAGASDDQIRSIFMRNQAVQAQAQAQAQAQGQGQGQLTPQQQ